jgi:integrase
VSQRKKEKNIFTETDKRNGRVHTVVSLQWPDGERFRRRCANLAQARTLLARINGATATGNWKPLRKELSGEQERDYTIKEFADVYLKEHCNVRNRRPDFKEEKLKHIKEIIGGVKVREFSSADAAYFEKERAKALDPRTDKPVSKATVNRGLAVLSHMMTFALKKRLISPPHPMARYGRLPEEEKALRVMTLEEERRLVQRVMDENVVIGCYVGLLGETGLRKTEGLNLKWDYVDKDRRVLTVAASKSGRTRRVPLSDYALELLAKLPRIDGCPFVFVWSDTNQPVRDPRYWFFEGRKKAGLGWVGFHDLRHFRATQWIMRGVDIRTVQGMLGHSTIQTTERYVKFVDTHASKVVIEAQRQEQLEWAAKNWQQTGNIEGLQLNASVN